eukprot:TRINITY_DN22164_c0_g1_i2.p1 TRINITY_DN22164_c0_g1~~TRINITY_DN22164_c0_g1_i2.p1  ORF type:complete len:160 (-),score=26.54 TRINITY_DN22164_c0_g1_i2:152-631(-)
MFPDQNLHYMTNFDVGYQGVNNVSGSEYRRNYNFDEKRARLSIDIGNQRYFRKSSIQTESSKPNNLPKGSVYIGEAESVPSRGREGLSYDSSVKSHKNGGMERTSPVVQDTRVNNIEAKDVQISIPHKNPNGHIIHLKAIPYKYEENIQREEDLSLIHI